MAKKPAGKGAAAASAANAAPKGMTAEQQAAVAAASKVSMPAGYKAKRQITMPTLSIKEPGTVKFLQFIEKMHLSNYVDPQKPREKPATIAAVLDVETGEQMQFLVPSVVQANLEREYKEDSYVTKVFRIACLGKRPNKRYRDFSIVEAEAE